MPDKEEQLIKFLKRATIEFHCGCIMDRGEFKPCRKHKNLYFLPIKQRLRILLPYKRVRFHY